MLTPTDPPARSRDRTPWSELILLAGLAGLTLVPITALSFPAAAALVLWLPGRFIVRLLNPLSSMRGRFASELGAAILFVPLYLNALWVVSNRRAIVLVAIVGLNAFLILLRPATAPVAAPRIADRRAARWGLGILIGYVLLCVFLLYWLPTAGGRFAYSPSGDYIKHHAVLWSLAQYRLPLHNLFFYAQRDAPYYYYHYHYLLPIAIRRLTGDSVSIATAFGLTSSVVAGLFIALTFLISRDFLRSDGGGLLSAVCVSIVGGWDIIPVLARCFRGRGMVVVLDSWSPFPWRIHNVLDNFIWCPQHVAAVVCLLLCAYWLSCALDQKWWIVLTPLAAASVFGTSLYQAMTMFAAGACFFALRHNQQQRIAPMSKLAPRVLIVTGLILLLILPQALRYQAMSHRYPGGLTVRWDRFQYAVLGRLFQPGVIANLLDAPWVVLIEFGLPGIACLLVTGATWRSAWQHPGLRLLMLAGGIGLLTMFIIRSNTTRIDYAFRAAVMPANVVAATMVGAMLRADAIRRWARRWRSVMIAVGCLLGVAVGGYELPVMAMRTMFESRFQYDEPAVLAFLKHRLSTQTVIQPDPEVGVYLPQMIEHQMGVLDPDNPHILVLRPPEPSLMYAARDDVVAAFRSTDALEAHTLLARWGITHVLAGRAERERYGVMAQFFDGRYFVPVCREKDSTVYELQTSARAAGGSRPAR